MKSFKMAAHEDSLLPEGKKWKLIWNDEFDGTELDRSKWGFRLNFWGKPFPPFTDEGVELDGKSHLRLHLIKKNGQFCSPHLQTASLTYDIPRDSSGFWPFGKYEEPKFLHKYGYYEIRCKMNRQAGWWTAFWLQSPSIGAHPDPRQCGVECDIMESQDYPEEKLVRCGNIWNGYGKNYSGSGHAKYILEDTVDGWHRFAVDWSKNGYVFYTDGKEVNRVAGPVSDVEQFILVSTESMGYRQGTGNPHLEKVVFPEYFEVDYVRVFDEFE
ncbi:MAG: hypothetical protein A2X49_00920 [Lentisphaerae bacterium GWF2_52_8]|nr:MAG: hypothetical protein A2X49_00920 [Lentisphaerae bacterium GWF2_52_8]